MRYFETHNQRFPTRHVGGRRDGEITWKPLTYGRTLYVLHDPIYAGAYVYGRHAHTRQRKPREKQHQSEVRLPQDQWLVLIWEAFPGYISRAEYEANQHRLRENRATANTAGHARSGAALLNGRVLCGVCGRPMRVAYQGTSGQYVFYLCYPEKHRGRYQACQRVPGNQVDQSVAQRVLQTLTSAELELSLQVLETITQQQALLQQQWQRRLEKARYAVALARRRYRQVEPEHRLVARTLEREWEAALATLVEGEQDYAHAHAQQEGPLHLDQEARAHLLALTHDLPALWHAASTTHAKRKELLRLLIADVTLTRQATQTRVQLRWRTNQVDSWMVPLPQRGVRTAPLVLERIRQWASSYTDAEIATRLNAEGLSTAHGQPFTPRRVHGLRRTHQIIKVQRASQASAKGVQRCSNE
ncbi:MAG: hypothetical protein GY792_13200 [Gammaproteobacteria bacterium]|nr:hypothetical protein [Gammaproteobacteria bacterium]